MKKEIEHQPIKDDVKNIDKSCVTEKFRMYDSYRLNRTLCDEELIKNRKYAGRVVRDDERWEAPRTPLYLMSLYERKCWFMENYKKIPKKKISLIRKEYDIQGKLYHHYHTIYQLYHYRYYD